MRAYNVRRAEAAERVYVKALLYLQTKGIIDRFYYKALRVPKKNSVEITGNFEYRGERYRHDFEFDLDCVRLPRVGFIRGQIEHDIRDLQKGVRRTVRQ